MAGFGVDLSGVTPSNSVGGGVIPKDRYQLQLTEGAIKDNSKGTGTLFEFTAEVVSGDFQGRKVWERLNITHSNPTAQKIGQEQLAALIAACGLPPSTQDSDDLLYQPFWADIDIETYKDRNGNEKEKNVIKAYVFETDEQAPPATKAAATHANDNAKPNPAANSNNRAPAAAASGGAKNMPWKR